LGAGLARADAVVLIGADGAGTAPQLAGKRVLRARLVAENAGDFAGREVVGFAGIGRPAKFFATLDAAGAKIVARHAFADHHPYGAEEMRRLLAEAEAARALLVTTAKDAVRLPSEWRGRVGVLEVAVVFDDPPALDRLVESVASRPGHA
jgi:tetraacyldisaccharide 4'-kinase